MSTLVYDGKSRAAQLRTEIKEKISALKKETGVTPTLAIVKVNKLPESEVYTNLKIKAAEEVGAIAELYDKSRNWITYKDVSAFIRFINTDPESHAVMVQLPFPRKMKKNEDYVIDVIDATKDADGMKVDSPFVPPVVRAVIDAVDYFEEKVVNKSKGSKIVVLGSKGHVGSGVSSELKKRKYNYVEIDKQSVFHKDELPQDVNLIISATGKSKLLGNLQVPDNVGVIDVGAPHPELNFEAVKDRLTFYTPVPGGIGPMTVAYLLDNLYQAAYNQTRK